MSRAIYSTALRIEMPVEVPCAIRYSTNLREIESLILPDKVASYSHGYNVICRLEVIL